MGIMNIYLVQIMNLSIFLMFIVVLCWLLSIKINNISAAIAVSIISIVEIIFASLFNIYELSYYYIFLMILLINPLLEESVRVRFSWDYNSNNLNKFLETSLMIGIVESIVKTFTFTIKYKPNSYFGDLNTYIILCGILAIIMHINFGLIFAKICDKSIYKSVAIMTSIHSIYNFLFIFTEPQQLINKNIHLLVFLLMNFLYTYQRKTDLISILNAKLKNYLIK